MGRAHEVRAAAMAKTAAMKSKCLQQSGENAGRQRNLHCRKEWCS